MDVNFMVFDSQYLLQARCKCKLLSDHLFIASDNALQEKRMKTGRAGRLLSTGLAI